MNSLLPFFSATEIILVHNGSHQDLVHKLKLGFPNVHHVVLQDNAGYSGGMNAGFEYFLSQSQEPWCL